MNKPFGKEFRILTGIQAAARWIIRAGYYRACAKHDVAVGMNAHSWRLVSTDVGNLGRAISGAYEHQSDAHSIGELDHIYWGVQMARRIRQRRRRSITWIA